MTRKIGLWEQIFIDYNDKLKEIDIPFEKRQILILLLFDFLNNNGLFRYHWIAENTYSKLKKNGLLS